MKELKAPTPFRAAQRVAADAFKISDVFAGARTAGTPLLSGGWRVGTDGAYRIGRILQPLAQAAVACVACIEDFDGFHETSQFAKE